MPECLGASPGLYSLSNSELMLTSTSLHNAEIYRGSQPCNAEIPSILKGGDYVKFTNATPKTFAVTATGIVPALAKCGP